MKALKIIIVATILIFITASALWPYLKTELGHIKEALVYFNDLHKQDPLISYIIFGVAFSMIILFSLPLDSAFMVLAGVTYNFWEAAVIVTICRFAMAVLMFMLGRAFINHTSESGSHKFIRKFEKHPYLGIFLLRLAPVPESLVNYGMSATSIKIPHYAAASIIGIIPLSIICVWMGAEMGSINEFIHMLG